MELPPIKKLAPEMGFKPDNLYHPFMDTNLGYGCLSDVEYSERFSWAQKDRWRTLIKHK